MSNKTHNNYNDLKELKIMNQSKVSCVSAPSHLTDNPILESMSFSFAGCGFLSFYYLGVTACLRQYSQINEKTIICGASSGTVAALTLSLDLPLDESTKQLLDLAIKVRRKPLGTVQPSCDMHKMIYDGLMKVLPENCHERVSGRLYVSVTRVSDGKNILISQFDSKEDLIRVIQCSSFMPFLSGYSAPKYKGIAYIDGALSNNAPKLTDNTITVSPWSGEFDICPVNDTSLPLQVMFYNKLISLSPSNLYLMTQIAFPPSWEVKSKLCQQGFDDTLRFLLRNNKILCNRCLPIGLPFTLSDDLKWNKQGDLCSDALDNEKRHQSNMNCEDCQHKRDVALKDTIPLIVIQAIEEACHNFNQSIINRLSHNNSIKLLLFLFIPFLLMFELVVVMVLVIFMNNWSSQVFADMLSISKIMITNGLTGRDQKTTFS